MFRIIRRELEQTVHREIVVPVRLNRTVVDDRALRGIVAFIVLYVGLFALGALGLVVDARRAAVDVQSFEALGAAAACLGNVGPGFGFAGPFGSYAPFSDLSTGVLTGLMWLGRLEIVPVAVPDQGLLARMRRMPLRRVSVGVEVGAALNLVGALLKYLSLAFLFPIPLAIGYSEPWWPFAASGAIGRSRGLVPRARNPREGAGRRSARGFLVVALTWLLGSVVAGLPYLLSGEEQLPRPVDALFEAMSGMTTTGSSVVTDIPRPRVAPHVAAVQPVVRRHGHHRARARRAAAAARRRATADGVGGARARSSRR